VVRSHAGQTRDNVLEVADKASVSQVLRIAVALDAVLCTDGSNFVAAVAKALALEHRPVDVLSGVRVRGAWQIQNVNAYHGGLRNGCAGLRASPPCTCPTPSADSARWTGTPAPAPSPRRCWRWP